MCAVDSSWERFERVRGWRGCTATIDVRGVCRFSAVAINRYLIPPEGGVSLWWDSKRRRIGIKTGEKEGEPGVRAIRKSGGQSKVCMASFLTHYGIESRNRVLEVGFDEEAGLLVMSVDKDVRG